MFRIEAVELEFQNGVKTAFERLYSQADGAVMIVPLLMDTTILLI